MPLGKEHFTLVNLPSVSDDVRESFEDLPKDDYGTDSFRRFSQYRVVRADDAWNLTRLPHRPLIMSRVDGSYVGGVRRYLEPVLIDATPFVQLIAVAIPLETSVDWQVDFHQLRIVCKPYARTDAIPKGTCQDWHHFSAVLVVERLNINNVNSVLFSFADEKRLLDVLLEPGSGIVFDQQRILHCASDIHCVGCAPGYRDVFLVDLNPWAERRYGREFQRLAMVD